jgi:hypothetical protein
VWPRALLSTYCEPTAFSSLEVKTRFTEDMFLAFLVGLDPLQFLHLRS